MFLFCHISLRTMLFIYLLRFIVHKLAKHCKIFYLLSINYARVKELCLGFSNRAKSAWLPCLMGMHINCNLNAFGRKTSANKCKWRRLSDRSLCLCLSLCVPAVVASNESTKHLTTQGQRTQSQSLLHWSYSQCKSDKGRRSPIADHRLTEGVGQVGVRTWRRVQKECSRTSLSPELANLVLLVICCCQFNELLLSIVTVFIILFIHSI